MKETVRLLKTKAMRDIGVDIEDKSRVFPKCAHHGFLSDSYIECIIRHFGTTVYHPTSSCKMGRTEDPTAVVDPQLRCKNRYL
jgi:choline dehydrogenase-like flavoprotein